MSPKCPWHKPCPQLAARRGQKRVVACSSTKALSPQEATQPKGVPCAVASLHWRKSQQVALVFSKASRCLGHA